MIRPAPTVPGTVTLPEPLRRTLSNGVTLHLLPAPEYGVVRFTFVFAAGTICQEAPFVASATANLASEGTSSLSAREVAERLDYYGSYFDVNIDRDYSYLSFCCLHRFFAPTLDVAREVLLRPAFPDGELESYRAKRRQRLHIERTKVDVRAREAFTAALFGPAHPYGAISPEEAYDRLTREQVVAFHRSRYTAPRCFVVASGRIDSAVEEALARLAAELPAGDGVPDPVPPAPQPVPFTAVEHPGAVQSSLRTGRRLFTRTHPDFAGMQVVAALLGGYFGSRLMQNLRARNGYTYGVMAAMVNLRHEGYLAVATQVGSEVTAAALGEIRREIGRLRTERATDEELEAVRNILTGETMRILDGPFGIADATIECIQCGLPNASVGDTLARIRAVTPDEVLRLARRYLDPDAFVTVAAGDPEALRTLR